MSEKTKPINGNPSPKSRFMLSADNITKHRNLVDSREFERGVDFALLEYQAQLMQYATDGNGAAAVGIKLRGVHEFLQTFRLLGEELKVVTPTIVRDHLPEPKG